MNGIQEVSGSIPLISTKNKEDVKCDVLFPFSVEGEPLTSCISIRPPQALSGVYRRKGQRFDPAYLHQMNEAAERLPFSFGKTGRFVHR